MCHVENFFSDYPNELAIWRKTVKHDHSKTVNLFQIWKMFIIKSCKLEVASFNKIVEQSQIFGID